MNAVVEALVFDLGDVLFSWAALTDTSIHPQQLKSILDSPTWHQYVDELSRAFDQARASLTANDQLVNLVKELRAANQQLRVYAMSNISVGSGRF
jgi:FMN phosphatase YigB (HAD superfamily)